jgi:hypothetical protein
MIQRIADDVRMLVPKRRLISDTCVPSQLRTRQMASIAAKTVQFSVNGTGMARGFSPPVFHRQQVAQGDLLPDHEREEILRYASARAKRIGRVLIGSGRGSAADRQVADAFRKWARGNGMFVRRRKAVRAGG